MEYKFGVGTEILAGPYKVPIVNGIVGLDVDISNLEIALSSLTHNDLENMLRIGVKGKIPIKVGIMYDLIPDPEKFDPSITNINPGWFYLNGVALVLEDKMYIERDTGQDRELARFLKERRIDEERLEHRIRENLTIFLYLRS